MGLKKIFTFLISLVLVLLLLSQLNFQDALSAVAVAKPMLIITGFALMSLGYLTRTLRFYLLLKKVSFKDLFNVVSIQTFANALMPARTGELSYIYLIKNFNIRTGTGLATLVVARSLDFIFISMFLVIGALTVKQLPYFLNEIVWIIAGGILLVTFFLIGIVYLDELMVGFLTNLTKRTRIGVLGYILRKSVETIQAVKILRSKRIALASGVSSMVLWIFLILSTYFFLKAFNVVLPLKEVILISSLVNLLPILPFYGIAGFGTVEATFTILMMSFGVEKSQAIVASFGTHILGLIYATTLAIVGMYKLRAPSK